MSIRLHREQQGFTLFEMLVVIGILAFVGGAALFVSMETYRGSSFRADRSLLVALLQHARAEAINNICVPPGCTDGQPHGVHIQSDQYVIFQGSTYDPSDDTHTAAFASAITTTKTPSILDIVFSQLSGTSSPAAITLADATGRRSVISISAEGRITWTP